MPATLKRAVRLPQFENHTPEKDKLTGYTVTNEEPELFNLLLKNVKVKRAACIASSGDMLLFALLRRVQEQIVAVDHSMKSLAVAHTKFLLLQKLGTRVVLQLLEEEQYEKLHTHLTDIWTMHQQTPERVTQITSNYWRDIRKEWLLSRQYASAVTGKVATRVTFAHMDLRQIVSTYGRFDLFYASNAMEHTGKDGKCPTLVELADILNPGGYLLYTLGYGKLNLEQAKKLNLQVVREIKGYRTTWTHGIAQKVEG
jgi:SAM-dependent methyltransferase